MRGILVLALLVSTTSYARSFNGLVVTELPPGGEVTVPGEYPIKVPLRQDVVFTGLMNPQAITFTNDRSPNVSEIKIYASHEKSVRTLRIPPGSTAIYNFKNLRPVRVKVTSGDVSVNSDQPLKIQR